MIAHLIPLLYLLLFTNKHINSQLLQESDESNESQGKKQRLIEDDNGVDISSSEKGQGEL